MKMRSVFLGLQTQRAIDQTKMNKQKNATHNKPTNSKGLGVMSNHIKVVLTLHAPQKYLTEKKINTLNYLIAPQKIRWHYCNYYSCTGGKTRASNFLLKTVQHISF